MGECGICKDPVKEFDRPRKAHLVIHKDGNDHTHVHGDLDKKDDIRDMLNIACEETGISLVAEKDRVPAEIVFHNRQKIGDMLMFTCAVRDFKAAFPDTRVNVISTAGHIWDHNPNIDRSLIATDKNTVKIGPSWLTDKSNRVDWHFANAYPI